MILTLDHLARTSAAYAQAKASAAGSAPSRSVGPGPGAALKGGVAAAVMAANADDSPDSPKNFSNFAEMKRICGMPVMSRMTEDEREEYSRQNVLAAAFDQGFRLFPDQCEAISQYEMFNGAFCDIPVGEGKSLCDLMIANKAYQKGISRIVLMIPPSVLDQFMSTTIRWARARVPINLPIHQIGGQPKAVRRVLCNSGKKGLYVFTYSILSAQDASESLNAVAPGLVIADEAHNLARASSTARARRVMSYMEKNPSCELVVLSGTMTAKSIRDYYHLIKSSLKSCNPLPNSTHMVNDWAALIDAENDATADAGGRSSGPIMPLVEWARDKFGDKEHFSLTVGGFRKAYQFRRNTSPGVVTSEGVRINCSLILKNHSLPDHDQHPQWKPLNDLMLKVTDQWLTPNGDEIDHAIHTWKWLNELTAGFYNELTWPAADAFAKRRRIDESAAGEILFRAQEHHAQGQVYHKLLRDFLLDDPPEGMDTPHLVGQELARHGCKNLPANLHEEWCLWKAMDFEGRPERDSRAVRVCDYKIQKAVEWAKEVSAGGKGAIIWYWHQEVGEWLHESLLAAGIESVHCPAGDSHNAIIRSLGDPDDGGKGDRIVVATYGAHGEGKNLQAFQNSLFVQWPRDSKKAEQTLGRLHRQGQQADELTQHTMIATMFDELNFAACLNDTLYQQQTTGNKRKVIYATYDPLPRIFPSGVLIERGLQAKRLSAQQQKELEEKFNSGATP